MKTTKLSIAEIAAMVECQTFMEFDKLSEIVMGISTDSRNIKKNEIFVALKGDNFDGHNYIAEAFKNGALAVISEKKINGNYILVKNSLQALGDIAQKILEKEKVFVIAITGSNGKTTVKEMLFNILNKKFKTLATNGNFNNLIGLPLTVFRLEDEKVAILEMGMNHFGEIKRLAEIANPSVALISSVGTAHLGFFKNIEEIAEAKGELFEALNETAIAVVNSDSPEILKIAEKFTGNKLFFGEKKPSQIYYSDYKSLGLQGQEFKIFGPKLNGGQKVKLKLLAKHNVHNALAAAAAALAAGANWPEIIEGLAETKSYPGRLKVHNTKDNFWIIDDSYNANPDSMAKGLEFLSSLNGNGQTAALLGDMGELGQFSEKMHRQIGALVAKLKLNFLATVGVKSEKICAEALTKGFKKENAKNFKSQVEAVKWLKEKLNKEATILVKGSRSAGLEKAVEEFLI